MHFNDLTSKNTDLYNLACDLDARLLRVTNELVGGPPALGLDGVPPKPFTESFLSRVSEQQDQLEVALSSISNSINWLEANVLDSTSAIGPRSSDKH